MKRWIWLGSLVVVVLWVGSVSAAEDKTAQAPAMCRCQGDLGPSVERIKQVLSAPLKSTGLDFTEEPLENVVNFLQEEYEIPIQIDEPSLEDAGLTGEEKVTASISNVSLQSALRLMLKTKQLTYVIRDEVLIITTPEEAETELVACVYDIRDLIGNHKDSKDANALVDVIVSCVASETWALGGKGEAEIKFIQPGLLVISQTRAVQDEIGSLLALIRESLRQPAPSPLGKAGNTMDGVMGNGMEGRGMGRATDVRERGGEMDPEPTPADETPFD